MVLPSEDDRDAIDRAFAELVAGYHLTADPPDSDTAEPPTEPVSQPSIPDANGAQIGPPITRCSACWRHRLTLGPPLTRRPRIVMSRSRCRRWDDPACRHCLAGSASGTRSSSCWQRPSACASPLGLAGSPSEASWVDSAS